MRNPDHPTDHWGDDSLDDGPQSDRGGVFSETSQIQGSDFLTMVQGPAVLPATGIWPDVETQGGKTLLDLSTRDHAPRVITITLGASGTYIGSWGTPWPKAEIVGVMEIGVGGMLFTAEIDFIEGVQFSLAVSKFKLTAVFRTVAGDTTAIPPATPRIQVGASAAIGSLSSSKSPQRTLTRANWAIGAAISEFWNLPHFAKTMRVNLRTPGFTPALNTTMLDTGGSAAASYTTPAPGGGEYPIAGGTLGVQVRDVGALPTSQYSLIFDLAL